MELPFEKAGSGRLRDFLWWPSIQGLDLTKSVSFSQLGLLFHQEKIHNGGASKHLLRVRHKAFKLHILKAKERSSSLPRSSSTILAGQEGSGHARREGGTMRYELACCPARTSRGELPGTQARSGSLELTPFPCFPVYKGRAWTG